MNRWIWARLIGAASVLFLACTASLCASAASSQKILRLVENEKYDRARKLCVDLEAEGAFDGPEVREACGTADLECIVEETEEGEQLDALCRHARHWTGTDAAARAFQMAAELALGLAGDDEDALAAVVAEFAGTVPADEALARLWTSARAEGSSSAARRFRERWPDAPQAGDARALESDLAFGEAEARDDPDGWEAFLEAYPEHPEREAAERRIRNLRFEAVGDQGLAEKLALAARYPDDPRATALRDEALDQAIRVSLAGTGEEEIEISRRAADADAVAVPWAVSRITIQIHELVEEPNVEVIVIGDDEPLDFQETYAAGLARLGMLPSDAKRWSTIAWEEPRENAREATLWGLCDAMSSATISIRVSALGEVLDFPFRSGAACDTAIDSFLRIAVPANDGPEPSIPRLDVRREYKSILGATVDAREPSDALVLSLFRRFLATVVAVSNRDYKRAEKAWYVHEREIRDRVDLALQLNHCSVEFAAEVHDQVVARLEAGETFYNPEAYDEERGWRRDPYLHLNFYQADMAMMGAAFSFREGEGWGLSEAFCISQSREPLVPEDIKQRYHRLMYGLPDDVRFGTADPLRTRYRAYDEAPDSILREFAGHGHLSAPVDKRYPITWFQADAHSTTVATIEEAVAYCESLDVAGATWRVPEEDQGFQGWVPSREAVWYRAPDGTGYLHFQRWIGMGTNKRHTGMGSRDVPAMWGTEKATESRIPTSKRRLVCVTDFPYADEALAHAETAVARAFEEQDRLLRDFP